jgi:hypothetical protein
MFQGFAKFRQNFELPSSGFKILRRYYGRTYIAIELGIVWVLKPRLGEQKRVTITNTVISETCFRDHVVNSPDSRRNT